MDTLTVLLVVGNALAILGGFWLIADRFRRWIDRKVAEPVARIETKVDDHDRTLKRHEKRIDGAHARIDRIWSSNA